MFVLYVAICDYFPLVKMPIALCIGFLFHTDGFTIRLIVEVVEEIVEEDGVGQSEHDGPTRVPAVVEQELGGVEERYAELELEFRKTSLLNKIITIKHT